MRDYMINSKVEISFVCSMQTKGTDVFDAESKFKATVRQVLDEQLHNNIAINKLNDNDMFLINIKCTTEDIQEGIVVHRDK